MFVRVVGKAFVCALLLGVSVLAPVAGATIGHRYSGQFGSGQLFGPGGVTIDQGDGTVFVADAGAVVVGLFNANGDFLRQWTGSTNPWGGFGFTSPTQVATDGSTVYVANPYLNAIEIYDTAGTFQGELDPSGTAAAAFGQPSGVAVDPANGDVYVTNTTNNVVDRFDSSGALIGEIGAGDLAGPTQVAVSTAHDLYVLDTGNARVVKYSGGTLASTLDAASPTAVGVDPSTDHVYVAEIGGNGSQIAEYAADDTRLSSFGSGRINTAGGIAVNTTTGRIYVGDQGAAAVLTFNQVTLPTVVTTPGATGVSENAATIAGTVDPEGVADTTYHFDYGLDQSYGNSTPGVSAGGGSSAVPVSESLTGLLPGMTYHFRLVGTNAQGSTTGADQTFTTSAAPAAVDGQPGFGSSITPTAATLNGTLNPNGAAATYHFDYGLTPSYGSTTPGDTTGATAGDAPVSAPVTGLQPGTTYHFRLVADNGVGSPAVGADATFTTALAAVPTATDVSAVGARLHATVNAQGAPASYHFEYGTSTSYGTSSGSRDLVAGTSDVDVDSLIGDLTPGTVYHFRVVTVVNNQTVSSDDATFTTVAAPTVTTIPAADTTTSSAKLGATLDTHGSDGTLTVIVTALDSAYGSRTSVPLAAADGARTVTALVADLPPGGDYVARAMVTSAGASTYGDLVTFSTPEAPAVAPAAPPAIAANPYGCSAPRLDAVNTRPKAGASITVTGADLGSWGSIALGDTLIQPTGWTATAITFTIPASTTGTQPLTINCGTASNTVGVAIFAQPGNVVTIAKPTVKGSTATLAVKVPGPGKIETSGANSTSVKKTVIKASTAKVTVHLSAAGKKALAKAKSKKLTVKLRVRFTPAGGTARSTTITITFKRGGTR